MARTGQDQTGPSPHPALGLHWGKSQKQQQKEKCGAFSRLLGLHSGGTRIAGSIAESTCRAACTQAGRCRVRGMVVLPALSDVRSHPPWVRSAASLPHCVCTPCDSSAAWAVLLCCCTVKTGKIFCWDNRWDKALPETPHAKATLNNKREFRWTKQVYAVNSVVWTTSQPFSTSTLCVVGPKGFLRSNPNAWAWPYEAKNLHRNCTWNSFSFISFRNTFFEIPSALPSNNVEVNTCGKEQRYYRADSSLPFIASYSCSHLYHKFKAWVETLSLSDKDFALHIKKTHSHF